MAPAPPPAASASPAATIGVVDTGAYVRNAALQGNTITVRNYVGQGMRLRNGLALNPADITRTNFDFHEHGTYVSQIIAGQPVGHFAGGQVPGASLMVAAVFDLFSGAATDDVAAAWAGLYGAGVRLFNNSLGSYANFTSSSLLVRTLSDLVAGDSLLVFAAGNESYSQPTSEASLGVAFPALAQGLLVAAGANANGTDLHANSNACGSTAAYCLVAPYVSGELVHASATSPSTNSFYVMHGTSGSAPLVTGTAARVWNAFPWMSASNVQQTVLTTATYLGNPWSYPYNAETGWGLLNPARAVRGPAMFHATDFLADVDSGTYEFSNDISGNAGLRKSGPGTLVLSGQDTYAGATHIAAGELLVTGSLASDTFLAGGTLSGPGSVGHVTNLGGTVSTQHGSLGIHGNYVQGSGATLAAYVGNTLLVGGMATLGGQLAVKVASGQYVAPGTYSLLSASGGFAGDFQSVAMDSVFLSASTSRSPTTYSVQVTQAATGTITGLSADAGGTVAATAADALFQSANQLATASMAGTPLDAAQTAFLSAAAGVQSASSIAMAQATIDSHAGTAYAQIPQALLQAQDASQQAAIDRAHGVLGLSQGRAGAWIAGSHVRGHAAPTGWNASDSRIDNLSIGYDDRVDEGRVVGGHVDLGSVATRFDRHGGTLKSQSVGAGIYGKADLGPVYFMGQANLQYGDVDLARSLVSSTGITGVDGATRLTGGGVYGELGFPFRPDSESLVSPYVGAFHEQSKMRGFRDMGAQGMDLVVSSLSVRLAGVQLGLRGSMQIGDTGKLSAHIARRHVTSRDAGSLAAAFAIDPSVTYRIPGPDWRRASTVLGLSFSTALGKAGALYLMASGTSSGDSRSSSFSAAYRHSF